LALVLKNTAAKTPGTQQQRVNKNTINNGPQPLSKTEKGGKITHKIDLSNVIV